MSPPLAAWAASIEHQNRRRKTSHAYAIGRLFSWGGNSTGETALGNSYNIGNSSPQQVGSLQNWMVGGYCHRGVAFLNTDKQLWVAGQGLSGQLGMSNETNYSSPVQVGTLTNWSQIASSPVTYDTRHFFGIKTDGTLWAWGKGLQGALGDGTTVGKSSPIQIGSLTDWKKAVVNTLGGAAIRSNGTLWTWGSGTDGKLGDGTTVSKSSPVQVGSDTDWIDIVSNYNYVFAKKTNQTWYSWGGNSSGELWLNDTVNRSSPIQIPGSSSFAQVCLGRSSSFVIKTDGTLWFCGLNGYGVSGLGDANARSSPVQVGTLFDWAKLPTHGVFDEMAFIKADGTLWVTGRNLSGALGLGDITSRSSPCQVGAQTDWLAIVPGTYGMYGIKSPI